MPDGCSLCDRRDGTSNLSLRSHAWAQFCDPTSPLRGDVGPVCIKVSNARSGGLRSVGYSRKLMGLLLLSLRRVQQIFYTEIVGNPELFAFSRGVCVATCSGYTFPLRQRLYHPGRLTNEFRQNPAEESSLGKVTEATPPNLQSRLRERSAVLFGRVCGP